MCFNGMLGLDKTHNPEFTTCEFYLAYADLEKLLSMTESLLAGLSEFMYTNHPQCRDKIATINFSTPFRRIDFIPGIEKAIGRKLPDLTGSNATSELLQIYEDLSLPVPTNPTLPRLLDKLCSEYLEPQCHDPTYIINPPECLSPLSKTFTHPTCNQRVAARGELFIEGKEIINTYEEENSPVEQRRKFQEQLQYQDKGEQGSIDENYIHALEWGLPPTGGWGGGIDRLAMLFSDSPRIGDVLSFGNLRAVTRPHVPLEDSSEN
jgi:lysyl-tRNA synthetase class 2